ncbi:hypothetical protein LWM68_14115 [Niabella sp. W65]|nr:hypothetical protein [Niabella sp. W65]MCH7363784.1 hypothetical protein [Niabella sp. W65]
MRKPRGKNLKITFPAGMRCASQSGHLFRVGKHNKNEVLYRIGVHPLSKVGDLPPRKLTELIDETRNYSFDFLNWKKPMC